MGIPLPASTQWEIVAERADLLRPAFEELIRQAAQGGKVQMIVVIVAQQYDIDGRQIVEFYSRRPAAARTDPAERAGSFGPDGIGQNVGAVLLNEHCGMVDERYP